MLYSTIFVFFGLQAIIFVSANTQRIVNGTPADDFEFPYMVSIRSRRGMHDCGGTILDENTIITAGHCVCGLTKPYPTIQYGIKTTSVAGPTIVQIAKIICHEEYAVFSNSYAHNDIALVKVVTPMNLDERNVAAVQLPPSGMELETGTSTLLLGWGLNATNGIVQTTLQKVDIEIISEGYCKSVYEGKIIASNICAGKIEGGKGQCNGDSGGPLLSGGFQIGIVSWSEKPCAAAPYPGVFTKVSSFIEWINQNI